MSQIVSKIVNLIKILFKWWCDFYLLMVLAEIFFPEEVAIFRRSVDLNRVWAGLNVAGP